MSEKSRVCVCGECSECLKIMREEEDEAWAHLQSGD